MANEEDLDELLDALGSYQDAKGVYDEARSKYHLDMDDPEVHNFRLAKERLGEKLSAYIDKRIASHSPTPRKG